VEDILKMNEAEAVADKAGVRIAKAELFDIAVMLGFFVGVVGIISLVFGDFVLLPYGQPACPAISKIMALC
jgi:hypothetical protein